MRRNLFDRLKPEVRNFLRSTILYPRFSNLITKELMDNSFFCEVENVLFRRLTLICINQLGIEEPFKEDDYD